MISKLYFIPLDSRRKHFLPYNKKRFQQRAKDRDREMWVKGRRRYVITVSGVLTSKASVYGEISQSLGVQFGQVRTRGLLVCMGLLQAKNSELGEVWLPRGADEKQEKAKPGENTDSELCSCFNTNQNDDGVRTRLLGSLDLRAAFNLAEWGNGGEINLLKDELHK